MTILTTILTSAAILSAPWSGFLSMEYVVKAESPEGQKAYAVATFSGAEVRVVVTGYTSAVEETDDSPFITASGTRTRTGIVACPRKLPFGTKVEIEGKVYVCEDRMALKNDGKYDIWFETKEEAYAWGKKTITVKIYE